jgi:CspA family cold shock protein
MSFRDTLVTCQECGKQFVFTVEKQRKMADAGQEVVIPDTCSECLQKVRYGGKLHGRIKWFSEGKGYGFIVEDSGGEIFLHRNNIPLTAEGTLPRLDEGQEVLYESMDTPKGPQAVKVELFQG